MKTSFTDLLSDNKIVIPIIQRDYAQGRIDTKTAKIRKDFLDAIFDVLKDKITKDWAIGLELDFIYGFSTKLEDKTTFAPIDGQQRLTTLWLFLWYVSVKENITDEKELELLRNFKYETRHSTTVFCEKLLKFKPEINGESIADQIRDESWYFEAWDFDPSIRAMLVMLSDIEERYKGLNCNKVWDIFMQESNPFYFYKLDMEKVGLPDDLYIKMNSRGKPLTEFEYFKAGFLDIIKNEEIKRRFEDNIDQKWAESIWQIVLKRKNPEKKDIAFLADDAFIRLINFITAVLAYMQGRSFTEINHSLEETAGIYGRDENLIFLFDILDLITELQKCNPEFWSDLFYIGKSDFSLGKTRIFFQNSDVNLLEKCLTTYDKYGNGFSYPEQLLLYACFIHLLKNRKDIKHGIRIVRNLVANSENELRELTIGLSFAEIENFVQTFDFNQLIHFKSDQISEEKGKFDYIRENPSMAGDIFLLEDSEIFRGCISIFDLDQKFTQRKNAFLKIFDEDMINSDFINCSNILLCFGDYSQDDGYLINMLARAKGVWRKFFTTPAYNKSELTSKTKTVLINCLDFFSENEMSVPEKINESLILYNDSAKDWRYYFLKYPGLRNKCNKGFYRWENGNKYPKYKMKERQFNGYHWDPFLDEIKDQVNSPSLRLDIGGEMQITVGNDLLQMTSHPEGFLIENKNDQNNFNISFSELLNNQILTPEGLLKVSQTEGSLDLEDRVKVGAKFLSLILNTEFQHGNSSKLV